MQVESISKPDEPRISVDKTGFAYSSFTWTFDGKVAKSC